MARIGHHTGPPKVNSQCCLKAFRALGKSPLDQSIFGVLPAEEFPSILFAFSLRLYSDPLSKLGGFLLGVNSTDSDTCYVHDRYYAMLFNLVLLLPIMPYNFTRLLTMTHT